MSDLLDQLADACYPDMRMPVMRGEKSLDPPEPVDAERLSAMDFAWQASAQEIMNELGDDLRGNDLIVQLIAACRQCDADRISYLIGAIEIHAGKLAVARGRSMHGYPESTAADVKPLCERP